MLESLRSSDSHDTPVGPWRKRLPNLLFLTTADRMVWTTTYNYLFFLKFLYVPLTNFLYAFVPFSYLFSSFRVRSPELQSTLSSSSETSPLLLRSPYFHFSFMFWHLPLTHPDEESQEGKLGLGKIIKNFQSFFQQWARSCEPYASLMSSRDRNVSRSGQTRMTPTWTIIWLEVFFEREPLDVATCELRVV